MTDAHVHDLISGSQAVFTVNSGVGLEALLLRKPVFVWGRSIYEYASTPLPTVIDMPESDLLRRHPFNLARASRLIRHPCSAKIHPRCGC